MEQSYKWHEDPSRLNLYVAEIGALKRGLGGDFELLELFDPQQKDGRVIAVGELSFSESQKQAIQIIYPTKYPYAPPRIISVILNITEQNKILEPIQPFHFGKGNQYGDGALCLFPKEYWNSNEHNIGWVLRRAQKWLISASSEKGFKPEEIVEEYAAPIKHIGQVLLPKEIELPKSAKNGEFILTQFKPNHFILADNQLTNYPFQLQLGKEVFRWYKFKNGITFKDLFPALNANTIYKAFETHFGENITEGSQNKNIAINLPSDDNKWHFFKLIVSNNGAAGQIIAFNYFLARNISEELYLRTSTIFSDKVLQKKRVTIIGLGAIGSEVGRSLARNAVGHFNLFDNDTFEIGNSVRHAADLYYIGENKVDVAKYLIQKSNPNITVNTHHIDVLNDIGLLEESLKKSDLCIVLTGEDSVDYLINDKYLSHFSIPFVFARVSAGGVSGSIQIVNKEHSACLRCLSNHGLDYLPKPKTKTGYSELKPEYGSCSSPPLPGSEIDTKEIALQVSRISLQLLLGGKNTNYSELLGMQYYWHGPYGTDEQLPFTWEITNHPKNKECKVCGL